MRSRLAVLVAAGLLAGMLAPAPAGALDIGVGAWEHLCPSGAIAPPARCLGPDTLALFGQRPVSLRIRVAGWSELPAARALGTLVAARGGRVIYVLQGGSGPTAPDSGRRRRAYQRLVAAAHAELGTLGALEIWNEPNLASQWRGGRPRPDHYGRLVCAAHAAAPDARLLLAGLAHPHADRELPSYRRPTAFLRATIRTMRHACPAALTGLAGLSAHPYGTPTEMVGRLRALRRVLNDQDLPIALHVTEFGWPVAGPRPSEVITPERQAMLLQRVLTRLAGPEGAALRVEGIYYFALADGEPYGLVRGRPRDFPMLYTGLLDATYAPRPAWTVLLDWLAGLPPG